MDITNQMYSLYRTISGRDQFITRFLGSQKEFVGLTALRLFKSHKQYYDCDPAWKGTQWDDCRLFEEETPNSSKKRELSLPTYWENNTLFFPIFDEFLLDDILRDSVQKKNENIRVNEILKEQQSKSIKQSFPENSSTSTGDPHMDELLKRADIQWLREQSMKNKKMKII